MLGQRIANTEFASSFEDVLGPPNISGKSVTEN
jgi:hypothetical protein